MKTINLGIQEAVQTASNTEPKHTMSHHNHLVEHK